MNRGNAVLTGASFAAGTGALVLLQRLGSGRLQDARWILAGIITVTESLKNSPAIQARLRRSFASIGASTNDEFDENEDRQLLPVVIGMLRALHTAALTAALASDQLYCVLPVLLLEAAASSHLSSESGGLTSGTLSILLSSSASLLTASASLDISGDSSTPSTAPGQAVIAALLCVAAQVAASALSQRIAVAPGSPTQPPARRRFAVELATAIGTLALLAVFEHVVLLHRGLILLVQVTWSDILVVAGIAVLLSCTELSFLSVTASSRRQVSAQTTVYQIAASQLAAWVVSIGASTTFLSQALITLLPSLLGFMASDGGSASYRSVESSPSSGLHPRLAAGIVGLTFLPSFAKFGLHHAMSASRATTAADIDVVISHYNEDLDLVRHTLDQLRSELPGRPKLNIMVYSKGPQTPAGEHLVELKREGLIDSIIEVPNLGREGETYLKHIVNHYSELAPQTLFLQPHIAWDWVALPRLRQIHPRDGFVSLGPYLNATGTPEGGFLDTNGQTFGRIPQIYASFTGELCPSSGFAITYAGQFLVSRQRIHRNPRWRYQSLLEYFDAPIEGDPKSWIWGPGEGWWNSEPSNPTLGHALERSWPSIFSCNRPELAWDCGEDAGPHCGCRD